LIPDLLFVFILNFREIPAFPRVNKKSVASKRYWNSRTAEQRAEFSQMRSEVQKKTYANLPKSKKQKISQRFSIGMQAYWDSVTPEEKASHVKKMSAGMKKAWENADEDFGPKLANARNIKKLNKGLIVEKNLPRVNDYCGVISASDMAQLDG